MTHKQFSAVVFGFMWIAMTIALCIAVTGGVRLGSQLVGGFIWVMFSFGFVFFCGAAFDEFTERSSTGQAES